MELAQIHWTWLNRHLWVNSKTYESTQSQWTEIYFLSSEMESTRMILSLLDPCKACMPVSKPCQSGLQTLPSRLKPFPKLFSLDFSSNLMSLGLYNEFTWFLSHFDEKALFHSIFTALRKKILVIMCSNIWSSSKLFRGSTISSFLMMTKHLNKSIYVNALISKECTIGVYAWKIWFFWHVI